MRGTLPPIQPSPTQAPTQRQASRVRRDAATAAGGARGQHQERHPDRPCIACQSARAKTHPSHTSRGTSRSRGAIACPSSDSGSPGATCQAGRPPLAARSAPAKLLTFRSRVGRPGPAASRHRPQAGERLVQVLQGPPPARVASHRRVHPARQLPRKVAAATRERFHRRADPPRRGGGRTSPHRVDAAKASYRTRASE